MLKYMEPLLVMWRATVLTLCSPPKQSSRSGGERFTVGVWFFGRIVIRNFVDTSRRIAQGHSGAP